MPEFKNMIIVDRCHALKGSLAMPELLIRKAVTGDWPQIWPIVQSVFKEGNSYPHSPDTTEEEAFKIWMVQPVATYVALEGETVVGTYYLKPNQPGLGSHVCNAGYMVHPTSRGRGIGKQLCAHSLKEAVRHGFKAMQFNLVVSTNTPAVKTYTSLGFTVVGVLPGAFNHKDLGYVDALVMYQKLDAFNTAPDLRQ